MAQGESGIFKEKKKVDHYLAQDTSAHSKWQEEMANINLLLTGLSQMMQN